MKWCKLSIGFVPLVILSCLVPFVKTQRVDRYSCDRSPTHTSARNLPGDNGFTIKVLDSFGSQASEYAPGQEYKVVLNGSYANQQFLDFMLIAYRKNDLNERSTAGHWTHMLNHMTTQDVNCNHILTSVTFHPSYKKSSATFFWTAPTQGSGCVLFKASVIEHQDIWYKDDGGLTKMLCEKSSAETETTRSGNKVEEVNTECCACDVAKYELTFRGLWSRDTHPKYFPASNYESLLHWSDIIGASHSGRYNIWREGELASSAVKEVCEYGWPRSLEGELKQQGRSVRTILKAAGVWGYPAIHTIEKSVRFSTDNLRSHISLLTMVGPSPDWCVGMDSVQLCLPNCTWIDNMEIPLMPWDAGTDSGLSYLSSNQPTFPRENIHFLTNAVPNNTASPFFGPRPVEPLATIKIRRVGKRHSDSSDNKKRKKCTKRAPLQADEGQFISDVDGEVAIASSASNPKCMVSEWSEYTDCSVTCGIGIKSRSRMFKHPMGSVKMCPDVKIEEYSNCLGLTNECGDGDEVIDICITSTWSSWSPCSVSCGTGDRVRTRQYLSQMGPLKCTENLRQLDECVHESCDEQAKDWAAICKLDADPGRCRGSFPQFYYDMNMGKCLPFEWGGCRGNENRFEDVMVCEKMCSGITSSGDDELNIAVSADRDCKMTPWSEYTECSASCGPGTKSRHRSVMMPASGAGKRCPKDAFEIEVCTSSCDPNVQPIAGACELSEWGAWSEGCSVTCGLGIQMRLRTIINTGSADQSCADELKEMRTCYTQECDDTQNIPCMMSEWSQWSMCKTCRQPSTIRQRDVLKGDCGSDVELEQYQSILSAGPLDCVISDWSPWAGCPDTCETSQESRFRMITQPTSPGGNCAMTEPKEMEFRSCPLPQRCGATALDCVISDWTSWTGCADDVCEESQESRFRMITQPASAGGDCAMTNPKEMQFRSCPLPPHCGATALDCVISDWTSWTGCADDVCEESQESRFRMITQPASTGGDCAMTNPKEMQFRSCGLPPHCEEASTPICRLADWSEWTACSKTCGRGKQVRRRRRLPNSVKDASCKSQKQVKPCFNEQRCAGRRRQKKL